MPTFIIYGLATVVTEVEAENEDKAIEIARNSNDCDFEIVEITKIFDDL